MAGDETGLREVEIDSALRRKGRLALLAFIAPALAITLLALWAHETASIASRYAVVFSRVAELTLRLERHIQEEAREEHEHEPRSREEFIELLVLYSALRAADADGAELASGGEDKEAREDIRTMKARYGVSARDSAIAFGLLSDGMPDRLGPLWEAEGEVGAGEALEDVGAEILLISDRILRSAEPRGPEAEALRRELAALVHDRAEPLLDKISAALRSQSEMQARLPGLLTFAIFVAAVAGALFAHIAVQTPLRRLVVSKIGEIRREAERARRAEQAKSDFLANMSHEIRTPMNGVMGMTELLGATELTARQRNFVGIIDESSRALLTLINEILDFSKIDAGQMRLDPAPFRLSRLVAEPASLVSRSAAAKNVEIVARIAPNAPARLVGDFGRLRQVMVNLVGNAVKFTESGQVEIDVETTPAGEGRVRLRIEVRDSGCGVAEEDRARIFEKFTQVDGSVRRKAQGAGLGLAISAGLIDLMGGRIGVDSEIGVGSTFHIELELPVDEGADAPAAPPREYAGLRILVIDDNETNRMIMQERLAAWRFSEASAASGREGLTRLAREAARGAPFDLVILDHHMPGMSGEDTLAELRSTPGIEATPAILLGSLEDAPSMERMGALGLSAALAKPALASDLLDAIALALSRAPAAGAAREAAGGVGPASVEAEGPADVLVADDNPVNRLLAMELVARLGLRAEGAEDGDEALAMIARSRPRIVLMDVSMPVLDGLSATRRLRERERAEGLPRLPVIGLTAHAYAEDRRRCLEAGMDEHLPKPISGDVLAITLDRWLDRPEEGEGGQARSA